MTNSRVTDTSEKGLETLITNSMVDAGWIVGNPKNYNREYAVDLVELRAFLNATQEKVLAALDLENDSPTRHKFLARLQGEITKRGVIDVMRKGIKHGPAEITFFYGTPSPGNTKAVEHFAANRFSVTRQLRYSQDETRLALDLCLFINGLPIATFELKNSLTKQVVHFAVDEHEVRMCTNLKGKASWFLPFNKGWNDGAGNPPNPNGLKTDYLWREILTPKGLTNILEKYAQVVEKKDERTGNKKKEQVFPRYHQLGVVRQLLASVMVQDVGKRYLIQHSAGSGKSNSIAWLAHQLISLHKNEKIIFDSIFVVTDRRILDQQIQETIKQFAQVGATIGHNDADTIQSAFAAYYRTTILSAETDPNKLHDLKADLDNYQIYFTEQIEQLVDLYLGGADRDKLDPILDTCVARYKEQLDEDGQVNFKSKAKTFVRTYNFLASILTYKYANWEKLSIFLNFLVPKLPAPREEDFSRGILETIDMDSYRIEKKATIAITLLDTNAEIAPIPTSINVHKPEPHLDRLSNIVKTVNDLCGDVLWTDSDRVHRLILEDIPKQVSADIAFQNAKKNSDRQNARIEHDKALRRVMVSILKDDTDLYKQFSDNESFQRQLTDVFINI